MATLFPAPVLEALRAAPDRPAFEGTRTVSRGDLLATTYRLAAGLRAAGLGAGSGVGLVLPLSPEAYATHLAAHVLGCRVAAARPGWSADQLAHAFRDSVDVVVTEATVEDLLAGTGGEAIPEQARASDVARLTYTSGSTGMPKACAHTYRAISLAYRPDRWPPVLADLMTRFERGLIHQGFASPVMFTYLGRCLVAGGSAVLADRLDPAFSMGEAIERHRITATMMPPSMLDQLLRSGADLRSLRAVVLGGSPAGPQLLRVATEQLGPVIWQGYGQAEAGVISMLTPDDIAAGRVTSVGRPSPSVEVSIRDGEVCVRSPHMMTGYWDEPERTGEVLRDGWLHTRDLGYVDADGLLYLTGRARDVIMVNAEVCYAGAIERVLSGHPDVGQAYVVGAPDTETGEAIYAFVVPAGDAAPHPGLVSELTDLVRSTLSANSVPRSITVIRDVPTNDSGKPDKQALGRTMATPHA